MLAMKRRALCSATLWNGHAPHTATGDARVSASHCQFVNCSAGIIESTSTGTVSTAEMMSRCRSGARSSTGGATGAVDAALTSRATTTAAPYPAFSTAAMRASASSSAPSAARTEAFSVA